KPEPVVLDQVRQELDADEQKEPGPEPRQQPEGPDEGAREGAATRELPGDVEIGRVGREVLSLGIAGDDERVSDEQSRRQAEPEDRPRKVARVGARIADIAEDVVDREPGAYRDRGRGPQRERPGAEVAEPDDGDD